MPSRDMTGPRGMGPMTGRGFGYGGRNFGRGRGYGGGFHGRGFGFGRNADLYYEDQIPSESKKTILENQMKALKDQLSNLENELSKLNDDKQKEEGWD